MNTFEKLTALPINHNLFRDDWDKRYNHTYMLYNDEVVYVEGRDGYTVYLLTNGKGSVTLDMTDNKPVNLKPWLPDTGYYCNDKFVIIDLVCNPQRQWKRSFTTSIYKDNSGLIMRLTQGIQWCDAIHNPTYHKEPIKSKATQNKDLMCISKDLLLLDKSIYYRGLIIGEVNFEKKQLKLSYPYFTQEVNDILYRKGLKEWNLM